MTWEGTGELSRDETISRGWFQSPGVEITVNGVLGLLISLRSFTFSTDNY